MTAFVALLRAVNVGGTGQLAMADLRRLCEAAGFEDVRTYIASGNVVFGARGTTAEVKDALEQVLAAHAGRRIRVAVRTAAEMQAVAAANPFPGGAPSRTCAIFLDSPPPADTLASLKNLRDEQVALGTREIYVSYGAGMADSKLVIPAARDGTARNLNTVNALARMAGELEAR